MCKSGGIVICKCRAMGDNDDDFHDSDQEIERETMKSETQAFVNYYSCLND